MRRIIRISRVAVGALLVLCAVFMTAARVRAQSADSLTVSVARAIREEGLVAVTWSLVTPADVTLGAAGIRDRSRGVPMQPDDRVQVGSVAKTLVATGVLLLVTDGRVALDAPITRYLPDVPIDNRWERDAPLLVRHLLDHTGGLADVHLWQVFTTRGDPESPLRAALGNGRGGVQVHHRPGDRFSYSNVGYLLLGMLIERVTGERYETWLDRELLLPLAMNRSTFAFVTQEGPAADSTLAMGHFENGTPAATFAIPVRASTQFTTTAEDMAVFARFLMSDGTVNGRRLVDSTLLRRMGIPTATEAVRAGLPSGYALGLLQRERWGITGKCHLGNIGTFRAILCVYPEHQLAFFASYNTDPEDANWSRVDSLFASSLGVPPTPAIPAAAAGVDAVAWNGWYVARPHRFPQFAYLDELMGVTRINWDGQRLALRPLPGAAQALQPVGGPLFRLDGRRDATHVLARSHDGVPIVSDGLRTFEQVPRWRVVALWLSALAGVLALLHLLLVGVARSVMAWRRQQLHLQPLRWSAGGCSCWCWLRCSSWPTRSSQSATRRWPMSQWASSRGCSPWPSRCRWFSG